MERTLRVTETLFYDCSEAYKIGKRASANRMGKLNMKDFLAAYPEVKNVYPRQLDRARIYDAYREGFRKGMR